MDDPERDDCDAKEHKKQPEAFFGDSQEKRSQGLGLDGAKFKKEHISSERKLAYSVLVSHARMFCTS